MFVWKILYAINKNIDLKIFNAVSLFGQPVQSGNSATCIMLCGNIFAVKLKLFVMTLPPQGQLQYY